MLTYGGVLQDPHGEVVAGHQELGRMVVKVLKQFRLENRIERFKQIKTPLKKVVSYRASLHDQSIRRYTSQCLLYMFSIIFKLQFT